MAPTVIHESWRAVPPRSRNAAARPREELYQSAALFNEARGWSA